MRKRIRSPAPLVAAVALLVALGVAVAFAENIDPLNSGDQYAWGENVGWLNAEPANCADCGVEVSDTSLTGYMWGENIGWINLSCQNNGTCGTVNFGVTNDGAGDLAGYAWGENVGWLSFSCSNTSSCGIVDYGVTIDPATGVFSGYAWGENIGWISLSCSNTGSCGAVDYAVRTEWLQDSDGDGEPDVTDNCPLVPTVWYVPAGDDDCDGWTSAKETAYGTLTLTACPANTGANNEDPDPWPPDFNDSRTVDVNDLLGAGVSFKNSFGAVGPNPPYYARLDLSQNNVVDVLDLLGVPNSFKSTYGMTCVP